MNKSDIEVKYLLYDPFDVKTIGKLEEYDEFKGGFGLDKGEVCAYIILMYDKETQLRRELPYFNKRKLVAAEIAGFKQGKDGKLLEKYENILLGRNEKVNSAISKYIRLFASPKYLSLVYYWSILSAEFENVTSLKESKDFKNTIGNIEKLEIKINECVNFLYGGDEVKDIQKALYESVEKENLKLRPENIASMSEEELDEQLGSPYGDYKPEPLKYKGHR